MKTVQTNCIQTQIDHNTGEFIGYRLTLPVPKEFAGICQSDRIIRGKNKVSYYTTESKDFVTITKIKVEIQLAVNTMKIRALQQRHIRLRNTYSKL